ncbi:MAG: hypothetical protein Q9187_001491 [Circinaria calcarea]
MPYNTRRKSLSLPALGIQLPNGSRAHRPSPPKSSAASEAHPPPAKKVKRSHTSSTPSPTSPSRSRSSTTASTKTVSFVERPKSSGRNAYEHTPPPSPGAEEDAKVDTEGINDDIVVGVIEQLEKTGNRPHLVKELAAVLSNVNDAVAGSANPAALLSSRLAAYMRRSTWTPLCPCPIGKELIPVHPRKVYYFLTTIKRQEMPIGSSGILSIPSVGVVGSGGKGGKRIISPSLSNASIDEDVEGIEDRKRAAMSPSPEVDLSDPDLGATVPGADDEFTPSTPAGSSFSARSSLARDGSCGGSSEPINLAHNHRGATPPLEGDEKEFTQTASSMRMRGMSLDDSTIRQSKEVEIAITGIQTDMHLDETEEEKVKRNSEVAAALFGGHHHQAQEIPLALMSSPLVKPLHATIANQFGKENIDIEMGETASILGDQGLGSSWDIKKPENVDLDELDALLGGF